MRLILMGLAIAMAGTAMGVAASYLPLSASHNHVATRCDLPVPSGDIEWPGSKPADWTC
jgi:hypothetical protein